MPANSCSYRHLLIALLPSEHQLHAINDDIGPLRLALELEIERACRGLLQVYGHAEAGAEGMVRAWTRVLEDLFQAELLESGEAIGRATLLPSLFRSRLG